MKSISWIILFFIFLSSITFALTFTRDLTERVEIPRAFVGYMCLWDEVTQQCIQQPQENDQIVFGEALLYPTPQITGGPYNVNLFYFQDTLYRSTGMGMQYLQINCRTETHEKEGRTETTEVCDSDYSRKVRETGGGSIVTETGIEINDKFGYEIYFNEDNSFKDLIMRFRESSNQQQSAASEYNITYKLYSITGTVENVTWYPQ